MSVGGLYWGSGDGGRELTAEEPKRSFWSDKKLFIIVMLVPKLYVCTCQNSNELYI